MKILNVNMSLDPNTGGGTAERTFQMSRALTRVGIDCTILTTDYGLTEKRVMELDSTSILVLPCIIKRFTIPFPNWELISSAVKKADIIHIMNHWTILNLWVYMAVRFYKKTYVVSPAGALAIWGRSRVAKKLYNFFGGKDMIRNASGWIAITEEEKQQFEPYGVNVNRIDGIPNGIDPVDFITADTVLFRQKHKLGEVPFLLFVGRLNPIKGPDLLLEAFCSIADDFPAYHLVFVGPDQGLQVSLEKRAEQANLLSRIHFIGYLAGTEKAAAYHAAQLLVVPSRQEAMSIVALEAGACGTPVLLTDVCGFGEVARVDGGKVVSADSRGIAAGLREMLSDIQKLPESGKNLQALVLRDYSWDSVVERLIWMYERILEGAPKI